MTSTLSPAELNEKWRKDFYGIRKDFYGMLDATMFNSHYTLIYVTILFWTLSAAPSAHLPSFSLFGACASAARFASGSISVGG